MGDYRNDRSSVYWVTFRYSNIHQHLHQYFKRPDVKNLDVHGVKFTEWDNDEKELPKLNMTNFKNTPSYI